MYLRIIFSLAAFLFLFNGVVDYFLYRTQIKPLNNRLFSIIHWSVSAMFLFGVFYVSLNFLISGSGLYRMMWFTFAYFLIYLPKLTFSLVTLPAFFWRGATRRSTRLIALSFSAVVFASFLYGLTFGRMIPRMEHVELTSDRLPAVFSPLKVVQISDIHLGNMGDDCDLMQKVVDQINESDPDLVLFTGDLVNSRSEELDPFVPVLQQIRARLGVYAVLGNHDYSDYARFKSEDEKMENFNRLVRAYPSFGWTLLNNRSIQIRSGNDSVAIVGVENWGEPPFPQHGDLEKALQGVSDNQFKILLSHNPEHWRKHVSSDTRIDLTLAGHTHSMQFKLRIGSWQWSPAAWKYPLWSGLYESEINKLYVNDGLGYVFIPFRLGTHPEITLFTIHSKTDQK